MSAHRARLPPMLVAAALAVLALSACDDGGSDRVCGAWGSAFVGHGCPFGEPMCLETTHHVAADAFASVGFCPRRGAEVVAVRSSDPSVLRVDGWTPLTTQRVIDLAAGRPGVATLELETTDELAQLALTVEAVGAVELQRIARVVEGGMVVVRSRKTGVTGTPLVGHGGYAITAPPGITATRATLRTSYCLWDIPDHDTEGEPDFELVGDTAGGYSIATDPPGLGAAASLWVMRPAELTSVELVGETIYPDGAGGFSVPVWVGGGAPFADPISGVTCDWRGSRPITFENGHCSAMIRVATDEPLDLTCRVDGRDLGTVHAEKYVDFE